MHNRPTRPFANNARPVPWHLVLLIFFSTILLFGTYAYFVMRNGVNWLFWVYLIALSFAALAYVLYNHAFADANSTYETLPFDWSDEKKKEFLAARDERKRKSKWLLVIIFPLSITLMFDIIYLFFGDMLIHLFTSFGEVLGIW